MDTTKEPPGKTKVVDRRRFTDEGELREKGLKSEQPEKNVGADSAHASVPHPEASSGPQDIPDQAPPKSCSYSPQFIELVAMLAQQAEILLKGAEGIEAQPSEAHRFIDYLGILEEKTSGNLVAEEQKILSEIVFQLRTMYMQRTQ